MLKYLFALLLFFHGMIHLAGFAKAFQYGDVKQLSVPISKPAGICWLLTVVLFIIAVILFMLKKEGWWQLAIPALVLSQVLIGMSWQDAKWGTAANLIILVTVFAAWGVYRFEQQFRDDVKHLSYPGSTPAEEILTEQDLQPLPAPVQRYLKYAGVIGKPKVRNMHVIFRGTMREKGKDWFPFTSEQYNFFQEPARLFFMKATMFGITVPGYHKYAEATASMDIRLFGLFPIIHKSGGVMNKTETVTFFNDLCLMAPAALIDKRIQWQSIDSTTAKAIFTNQDISISAILYFNDEGQLINFISNDRTAVADMKQYPFSTPCGVYKNFNGIRLQSAGEAVWHYPDGDFTYGKFELKKIEYNCW